MAVLQYENAQNKPAVLAYAGGSVAALIFAEWLIHKPGLNIVSIATVAHCLLMQLQVCSTMSRLITSLLFFCAAFGIPNPASRAAVPPWSCGQVLG